MQQNVDIQKVQQEQILALKKQIILQNNKIKSLEQNYDKVSLDNISLNEQVSTLKQQIDLLRKDQQSISLNFPSELSILSENQYTKLEEGLKSALNQIILFKELLIRKEQQIAQLQQQQIDGNLLTKYIRLNENIKITNFIQSIQHLSDSQIKFQYSLQDLLFNHQLLLISSYFKNLFINKITFIKKNEQQLDITAFDYSLFTSFLVYSFVQISGIQQLDSHYYSLKQKLIKLSQNNYQYNLTLLLSQYFLELSQKNPIEVEYYNDEELLASFDFQQQILDIILQSFASNQILKNEILYNSILQFHQLKDQKIDISLFLIETQLVIEFDCQQFQEQYEQIISKTQLIKDDEFNIVQFLKQEVIRLKLKVRGKQQQIQPGIQQSQLGKLQLIKQIQFQPMIQNTIKIPSVKSKDFIQYIFLRSKFELE